MIHYKDLHKSFNDTPVLQGLTFTVSPGEIYGLLGPNGSGKTTAINILCNLLDADTGSVQIDGKKVSGRSKQIIGVVPQEIAIYRDLTCRENLLFYTSIYGLRKSARLKRIESLLSLFNLERYADTDVSKLSGGWQRRIHIAVALVHQPAILILDEPTAGLDIEARYDLWAIINSLSHSGTAILLTTHQLEEAERLCSRIGILREGQIAIEGTFEELCSTVPAVQLAVVSTEDEMEVIRQTAKIGWEYRYYGDKLTLLLPRLHTINEVIERFEGISFTTISLKEVGLEQVYIDTIENKHDSDRDVYSSISV